MTSTSHNDDSADGVRFTKEAQVAIEALAGDCAELFFVASNRNRQDFEVAGLLDAIRSQLDRLPECVQPLAASSLPPADGSFEFGGFSANSLCGAIVACAIGITQPQSGTFPGRRRMLAATPEIDIAPYSADRF